MYTSIMIELIKCTDKNQWNDYINDHNGHPLQLWGWGQVKETNGWSVDRVFVYEDEKIVSSAQILTRKLPKPLNAFSYVPRGPVGDDEEILNKLASYAKQNYKSVALSIEPEWLTNKIPDGWKKSSHFVLPADTILLDLSLSDSELLARMSKKTRQYIRKSSADVTIKQVKTLEQLDACLDIYQTTADRAQFDLHNRGYYKDVFNLMGEFSICYVALEDNKPIAFLWLAISETTAFELYGGMNDRGQELRANYALKWHAIKELKSWGLKRYDLGGLIGDGVANFKKSWSDEQTTYVGTIDKPLSVFYGLWHKALPAGKKTIRKIAKFKK